MSTPESAAQVVTQLTKLQDALLEGRIDKETYEKLKSDLLAVASCNDGEAKKTVPVMQAASSPTPEIPASAARQQSEQLPPVEVEEQPESYPEAVSAR